MGNKRNRGLRFSPFKNYLKAIRDAQKYRSLYGQAIIDKVLAEAREKLAQQERNFAHSLVEWLTLYPLQAKSSEELEKWRKDYQDFLQAQSKKYEERKAELRVVRIQVKGKNKTLQVFY